MSHGVFVSGRRPTSKAAIKRALAEGAVIRLENVSMHGGEDYYLNADPSTLPPLGKKIAFVGPDPYTKRSFYGTVEVNRNGVVVVK